MVGITAIAGVCINKSSITRVIVVITFVKHPKVFTRIQVISLSPIRVKFVYSIIIIITANNESVNAHIVNNPSFNGEGIRNISKHITAVRISTTIISRLCRRCKGPD